MKVGFPIMDKEDNPFVLNKFYEIHAHGFNEPIIGKIIDIKVTGEDILLVIRKSDDVPSTYVWLKAITGWTVIDNKRVVPAA